MREPKFYSAEHITKFILYRAALNGIINPAQYGVLRAFIEEHAKSHSFEEIRTLEEQWKSIKER